ncbi:ABC transporter permease [Nocardia sp. CDC159]|uniref:Transport permease protein n=1 Tax=Nocardia pulmonis TaxID=2951408 RepID=A0A9X2E9G4_9NOCA|nr:MULTISPECIES: ABC transporter permease [Nocardia]MCM6775305.1 ABC transporter permease [Nocardia pulmonis]MCM6787961.1 ABC transporter permease [Nocardia sp. CDC159]
MTTTARLPSPWRVGLARGGLELKQFFRERDSVVFTFALPIVLFVLFSAVFGETDIGGTVPYTQALLPAMITAGLASTTLVNLAIWIAVDRDNNTLRRLVTTPMSRLSYFLGKIIMVIVVGALETLALVGIGVVGYGVELPSTPQRWFTFAWVGVLALATFGVLGVALSSLPRSARSAAAVVNVPVLLLLFVSGIYVPLTMLPDWLQDASGIFPLRWVGQGLRSAFLPDAVAARTEAGNGWEHARVLTMLVAWFMIGLVACLTTFRWKRRGDG